MTRRFEAADFGDDITVVSLHKIEPLGIPDFGVSLRDNESALDYGHVISGHEHKDGTHSLYKQCSREVFLYNLSWCAPAILLLSMGCFIATYAITVFMKDVPAAFPYISDTGGYPPASCIFTFLLNVTAVFGAIVVYGKFRLVQEYYYREEEPTIRVINKLSAIFATASMLGLMMVASFQTTLVKTIHLLGAVMLFFLGAIYGSLQVWLSYKLPCFSTLRRVRLALSVMGWVFFVICVTTSFIAANQKPPEISAQKWMQGDKGWDWHIVSTITEWIMGLAFLMFLSTFYFDFNKHRIRLSVYTLQEAHKYATMTPKRRSKLLQTNTHQSLI